MVTVFTLYFYSLSSMESNKSKYCPALPGAWVPACGALVKYKMLSLIYSFKLYICQDSRIARAHTAQNTKKNALLACLARRLSTFTSMCGTGTAGRGASEPPPENGTRTKLFEREFQFRESHIPPADVICVIRSRKKTVACLYQIDV